MQHFLVPVLPAVSLEEAVAPPRPLRLTAPAPARCPLIRQTPSLKSLIDVVQSVSVSFLGDVNVMARRTPLFVHQVKTS